MKPRHDGGGWEGGNQPLPSGSSGSGGLSDGPGGFGVGFTHGALTPPAGLGGRRTAVDFCHNAEQPSCAKCVRLLGRSWKWADLDSPKQQQTFLTEVQRGGPGGVLAVSDDDVLRQVQEIQCQRDRTLVLEALREMRGEVGGGVLELTSGVRLRLRAASAPRGGGSGGPPAGGAGTGGGALEPAGGGSVPHGDEVAALLVAADAAAGTQAAVAAGLAGCEMHAEGEVQMAHLAQLVALITEAGQDGPTPATIGGGGGGGQGTGSAGASARRGLSADELFYPGADLFFDEGGAIGNQERHGEGALVAAAAAAAAAASEASSELVPEGYSALPSGDFLTEMRQAKEMVGRGRSSKLPCAPGFLSVAAAVRAGGASDEHGALLISSFPSLPPHFL